MQHATPSPIDVLPPPSGAPHVPAYRPGDCNIGPFEVARRRRSAIVGFIATAVLALGLIAIDAPPLGRAFILLPLWGALVGWLQARRRFCVGFAMAGLRNFGADSSGQERVGDPTAVEADRRTAARMIRDAFLIALPLAIAFALLPF